MGRAAGILEQGGDGVMIRASVFAALVSALSMASAIAPPAQAGTPCCTVDENGQDVDPPLHLPTLVSALEALGLEQPMLVRSDISRATLTFTAMLAAENTPVIVDVDITTGIVVERTMPHEAV
jgi:hypothetical protein